MSVADTNPEYWNEYSNLQKVKHELIHEYLKGWFPKLALGRTGCRRLLYIDTHAGRGMHMTGELGSPLVAVTTLLDHRFRDQMLQKTEVRYFFIERDAGNLAALQRELSNRTLPDNVHTHGESGDCFEIIEIAVAGVEKDGGKMAPGFMFVDPYGFKLPGKLLRRLLNYPKVELFVNVIWRELDMAIRLVLGKSDNKPSNVTRSLFDDDQEPVCTNPQPRPGDSRASLEATLNSVFDGDGWRGINADDADERADQCADLFRRITGAKWGTHLRMLDNGRVRYFLLHLTKHDAGRDLMKKCMWKACPDGGFSASKSDNPRQIVLIKLEPDLRPLQTWVRDKLTAGPKRWHALVNDIREELYLKERMNEVLRQMKKADELEYEGKFAETQNTLLGLATKVHA